MNVKSICLVVICSLEMTLVAYSDEAPQQLRLSIRTEHESVPPFVPHNIVVSLKNAGDQDVRLRDGWQAGFGIHVFQDGELVERTGYPQIYRGGDGEVLSPGEEIQWLYRYPHSRSDVLLKPGDYSIQAGLYSPQERRRGEPRGASLEAELLELTIRQPTDEEKEVVAHLAEHEDTGRMIRCGIMMPGMGLRFVLRTDNAERVLKNVAETYPDTIYADLANLSLSLTVRPTYPPLETELRQATDAERKVRLELRRAADRAKADLLDRVGMRSMVLHDIARVYKRMLLVENRGSFPEIDRDASIKDLELVQDTAIALGLEEPWKRAMEHRNFAF